MAPETTKLEADTRKEIDTKLTEAGWVIQDKSRLNLYASLGVAIRVMDTLSGPADYMLFIDGKACGNIEAKREGTDLGGVTEQSGRYANSRSSHIERWGPDDQSLPFLYEADVQGCTNVEGGTMPEATTNYEVRFRDERYLHPRSFFIFHFHRHENGNRIRFQGIATASASSSYNSRSVTTIRLILMQIFFRCERIELQLDEHKYN